MRKKPPAKRRAAAAKLGVWGHGNNRPTDDLYFETQGEEDNTKVLPTGKFQRKAANRRGQGKAAKADGGGGRGL